MHPFACLAVQQQSNGGNEMKMKRTKPNCN